MPCGSPPASAAERSRERWALRGVGPVARPVFYMGGLARSVSSDVVFIMSRVSEHGSSHHKLSNSLVALSSAAVLAVYTAGYVRTKAAADRFAGQAETRRPAIPAPAMAAPESAPPLPAVVTI